VAKTTQQSRKRLLRSFAAVALALGTILACQLSSTQSAENLQTAASKLTGLLYDDVYLKHLSGNSGHPERPERLIFIRDALDKAGLTKTSFPIHPRRVTEEELELVHKPSYIALVRRELSSVQGYRELSTGDTMVSDGSLEAAEFAAGGVLNAVDAVMQGKVKNAFAAVRPPGHHATPTRGMGFCIFNNVAIAARYVQKKYGLQRVLIVDWDLQTKP